MSANEDTVSKRVIGCAFTVSNQLGAGFLETVYENALALEFSAKRIDFKQQAALDVYYRQQIVGRYLADFVVAERLIIEIKALNAITPTHEAQLMNYLRATGLSVGLLLNFGTTRLGMKRIVNAYDDASPI